MIVAFGRKVQEGGWSCAEPGRPKTQPDVALIGLHMFFVEGAKKARGTSPRVQPSTHYVYSQGTE